MVTEAVLTSTHNRYFKNKKNITVLHLNISILSAVKFTMYLYRRVFEGGGGGVGGGREDSYSENGIWNFLGESNRTIIPTNTFFLSLYMYQRIPFFSVIFFSVIYA